ncbi:phenylalanine--tRNA ligase subunit beta [Sinanaerobacter chloroacetimidivorans]|uniref:Phenylalanine--tRNA ligase beta subunit n=1 Tax=Sinanaerobacter chloroacetimidivorans TaxID=2818044 RepID=A0A8J8B2A4_9FIRM|nr:phenylalanine--tRNA ligase subunit beta [Sinanaerobacter chloroacetimidivorans]MBR0597055.1 phenylalanine--tRNA ligase subunit beta [Sinanaerobacter chloroacetimidivorans]
MLVPIEWLKEYIDVKADINEFCEKMIMSGSNLETVEHFGEDIENVVVGKIVAIEKHPDADKLLVTQIDIGEDEFLQIVTGADNIFEGAYVPVVLHGGKLPGDKTIKRGRLRGVESNGMLCSAGELGFADKVVPVAHKDGIWILDQEYPLGKDIVEVLGLKNAVVDFEITPNRPDCLSMIGMAREAAATFGGTLSYPETECEKETGKAKDFIDIEIRRPDLCKRYVGRIVTDVKIEQSPWWLQKRLIYAGMRPINNIVDITNYVMLEYGQPIHAFDIRDIADQKIIVDTAQEGELFTTLDGTERKLNQNMLLIKDGKRGVAIAGVMGGLNSEIKSDTKTILVEAANFDGNSVRSTSKKLALRTEASSRFEKGIDPNLCETAADRVCKLIEILGAGTVVKGAVDAYPEVYEAEPVNVRVDRVNAVLGIELSGKEMEEILESLEMKVLRVGNNMKVTPPTIRQDLEEEIDFIEEVARIYGYDKMPVTLPKGNLEAIKSRERTLIDLSRETLTAMGANEVQTYSFVSPKGVDYIGIAEDSWERNFVRLINPLGEENSVMRTILTPNMMEVLGRNFSRNISRVRAFEIGNTFFKSLDEEELLPEERQSMVAACYGEGESFYTLKGMLEELFAKLGIDETSYIPESEYGVYHPGKCARILSKGIELGIMGEIHPDVAEKYGIGTKSYCCELAFDQVMKQANIERFYKPLPKYPAITRDIALSVKEAVTVAEMENVIKEIGGKLLESVVLFDVYRGKQVLPGMKSVAFSLTYRASDRTLTDEEVVKVHQKVLGALKEQLNAVLREM